ncbi:hypothetical protein [Clostridium butyricum]
MTRYLKTNNSNWRKLCKKQIKYEQQEIKVDGKMQMNLILKRMRSNRD